MALGLDIGAARIGVAIASLEAPFPRPLTTLSNPDTFLQDIIRLVRGEGVRCIVAGLPRGLDGQDTQQTAAVLAFGASLGEHLRAEGTDIPLYWIDEALTSQKAEDELERRNKSYVRGDIDALAATYILEDYFAKE